MTKTTIKAVIAGLLLAVAMPVLAQNNDGHNRSIADVIGEIIESQSVSSQGDIRCDDVTDDQFEELGDAVMQAMIGDDQQHELMDNMMGGEGSESLRSMHIAMGQRYLGCAQGTYGTMGMMGGMMSMIPFRQGFPAFAQGYGGHGAGQSGSSWGMFGPWGMMGGSWGIGMLLFWIIIIVGIVLLVKWLVGQPGTQTRGKSALDILKERYAKGEINKEEFESKKKDLIS